ncbi:MAG: hypothetical protein K9J25_08185 [Bacteroidales bacterium]|nr:hypothetical protein [Bacteroidales bacterium]
MMSAWLVIFLHAVIPHNHQVNMQLGCQELCHSHKANDDHGKDYKDNVASFLPLPDDHESNICHFSTELKHEQSFNSFFINEPVYFITQINDGISGTTGSTHEALVPGHLMNALFLRAPPYSSCTYC